MKIKWFEKELKTYVSDFNSYTVLSERDKVPLILEYLGYGRYNNYSILDNMTFSKLFANCVLNSKNYKLGSFEVDPYFYKWGEEYRIAFKLPTNGKNYGSNKFPFLSISFFKEGNKFIDVSQFISVHKLGSKRCPMKALDQLVSKDEFSYQERTQIGELLFSFKEDNMILAATMLGLFEL